jgi:hypothetical protein
MVLRWFRQVSKPATLGDVLHVRRVSWSHPGRILGWSRLNQPLASRCTTIPKAWARLWVDRVRDQAVRLARRRLRRFRRRAGLLRAGEWPAASTVIDLYGAWAAAVADAFGVA